MIAATNRKNWLTFGGDSIPDMDSRPLFHFRHHCGIEDFRSFISIFPIFMTLSKITDADKVMNSRHFGSDLVDT